MRGPGARKVDRTLIEPEPMPLFTVVHGRCFRFSAADAWRFVFWLLLPLIIPVAVNTSALS